MGSQSTRFDLPGFSLPLDYIPRGRPNERVLFPNALEVTAVENAGRFTTHREILMMQVMNSITEKLEWDRKVFDDEITSKWRKEIDDSGQDVSPKMMDWIVKELQYKAGVFQKTGEIIAFDPGVVKSDTAVPAELRQALREAVRPLEDVPEDQRDYHPGSNNKVVDLVHPSLFPVVYGRSRILPDKTIGLDDCLHNVGPAKLLPVHPEDKNGPLRLLYIMNFEPISRKFQWMPCDVEFADGGECRIVSYINNLHPKEHRTLYEVLEKVLARTIPLWNTTLTMATNELNRIEYSEVQYCAESVHSIDYVGHPDPEQKQEYEEESGEFWVHEEWERNRPIILPEPGKFSPSSLPSDREVRLQQTFAERGLQVIVKLANIELTPENPQYDGGTWHVEGQFNEHICASAIYYFDSQNITESTLSFRQRATTEFTEIGYEQDNHEFLQAVFGFGDEVEGFSDTNVTQHLGSVPTHEGRLLTFPNILQHRVSPFSLEDRSKPGHRKILALFLVDPHIRIISSANIPPQREDWWKERNETIKKVLARKLPVELQNIVVDYIAATDSIPMDEAKQYRLELMEERKGAAAQQNATFETGNFGLCEH